MLEMICAIPEEFGWALVGAFTVVDGLGILMIGKMVKTMVADRFSIEEEDKNSCNNSICRL